MMVINDITAVSIAVQINDKPYFVTLPHNKMLQLMNMASELFDNGKLGVIDAPDGVVFSTLAEEIKRHG